MSIHLERDLARIKRHVLRMGALVEDALRNATLSVTARDVERALAALDVDRQIDQLELDIDDECVKSLALHQPVARDLRFLTAVMKITTGLERIGDLAGNIAKRAMTLAEAQPIDLELGLDTMAEFTRSMLHVVLDAFVNGSSELARDVCARDDIIDAHNKENIGKLMARMVERSDEVPQCVSLLTVTRSVERVADHTTNIAEDVVFLVEAVDIRHPSLHRESS